MGVVGGCPLVTLWRSGSIHSLCLFGPLGPVAQFIYSAGSALAAGHGPVPPLCWFATGRAAAQWLNPLNTPLAAKRPSGSILLLCRLATGRSAAQWLNLLNASVPHWPLRVPVVQSSYHSGSPLAAPRPWFNVLSGPILTGSCAHFSVFYFRSVSASRQKKQAKNDTKNHAKS